MEALTLLRELFSYDDWANREALASLRAIPAPPERALGWMSHIVAAEVLWYARIRAEPSPLAVWPELSLDECEGRLAELATTWPGLLDELGGEVLSRPVTYTNSKGEPWTSSVESILTHVVMHSAYHRGQIASAVRGAGHEPAYTDLIHGVREGKFPTRL